MCGMCVRAVTGSRLLLCMCGMCVRAVTGGRLLDWDRLLSEQFGVRCHCHFTVLNTHQSNRHPRHIT